MMAGGYHGERLAVIAKDYGPPESFELSPFDPGPPGEGEVRIKVRAAGLSFVDALTAAGEYQVRPEMPFIPGGEIAGEVELVGPGVDPGLAGQRVLAASAKGALTHIVNVDAHRVWKMPDGMDFETGAAFRVRFITVYEALVRLAGIGPGESLLVLGAGGAVGHAAVRLGHVLRARHRFCLEPGKARARRQMWS